MCSIKLDCFTSKEKTNSKESCPLFCLQCSRGNRTQAPHLVSAGHREVSLAVTHYASSRTATCSDPELHTDDTASASRRPEADFCTKPPASLLPILATELRKTQITKQKGNDLINTYIHTVETVQPLDNGILFSPREHGTFRSTACSLKAGHRSVQASYSLTQAGVKQTEMSAAVPWSPESLAPVSHTAGWAVTVAERITLGGKGGSYKRR